MANETEAYKNKLSSMVSEIEKAVVGKRRETKLLLTAILSGGHVLIEDVPGTGKTTLASATRLISSANRKTFAFLTLEKNSIPA